VVTLPLILLLGFVGEPDFFVLRLLERRAHDDSRSVSGIGQTYHFAKGHAIHSAFHRTLTIWNGSLFSFSLATNITATSLIALRVW